LSPAKAATISWLCRELHGRKTWRLIMKSILSAIVALSVLTGVAASANAFDAKSFYQQFEHNSTR
jgi:hypothetical protein